MTPEELQNAREDREFKEKENTAQREWWKWFIDKLVTAGPGLLSAVLGFYIAYQGAANHTEIAETARVAAEAREVITDKIDKGHAVAKEIATEAKAAVEQAATAAQETKTAVAELKTNMGKGDKPE